MAFIGFIDIILFIGIAYFGIQWLIAKNSHNKHQFIHKYRTRFWVTFIIFILFMFIGGHVSDSESHQTNQSSHKSSRSIKSNKLTYLDVKPNDDGDGETTFNRNGKAIFNVYIHKGSYVYFNDRDSSGEYNKTHDGKQATLKKISPTHYRVIMNYQSSNDDSSIDSNTTNISAKAKEYEPQNVQLDGDDNSAEKSAIKQKAEKHKQQEQAKLAKEYPPIQDQLQSMSNNKLFMTSAMVKGKVLSWGAQNDGSGMILIKDKDGNEFTLEPSHRIKGIEDGSTIVAYGGNFDKQKINSSQTNNAISSEYLGDKVINMPSIDHIKLLGNKGDV